MAQRNKGLTTTRHATEPTTFFIRLPNGYSMEINRAKYAAAVRDAAEEWGFIRRFHNSCAALIKNADWAGCQRELERTKRVLETGQWSNRDVGFDFADMVEALVRLTKGTNAPMTHTQAEEKLLSNTKEQRDAWCAKPIIAKTMLEIRIERLNAKAESDPGLDDILGDL